jgi:hypothetical protein
MFRDSLGMPVDQSKAGIQPTQILTKDNVSPVINSQGQWLEPGDALDQYKKLWGMQ